MLPWLMDYSNVYLAQSNIIGMPLIDYVLRAMMKIARLVPIMGQHVLVVLVEIS